MAEFDVHKIRADFPILNQQMNNHPLVYLDNAATTQKPQVVIDRLNQYYTKENANIHRSVHTLGEQATLAYEDARSTAQHFINAKNAHECVFLRGATEAINLVAQSYVAPRLQSGEVILISEMEHHSNIVPWQLICEQHDFPLRAIPVTEMGELDLTAFENLLTDEVKFLSIGYVSNAIGTINAIKKMIDMAHANGTLVMVDATQAAPHISIDVQALDCDFLAISGHKMYGPTGIGVLYGKEAHLTHMGPYQGGGEMIVNVSIQQSEYQKPPFRFEAGTPNIAGAIGLAAAIDYLDGFDPADIIAHEQDLLAYATDSLHQLKGFNIVGEAKNKASILSFTHNKIHPHDIGTVLSTLGVAVRSGHHCAMPLMQALDIIATTRISIGIYNTKSDIDAAIKALEQMKEVFG